MPRHALTPREFGAHVGEAQPGIGEQDGEVEDQVGGFGHDAGIVARAGRDDGLDRLLAQLLRAILARPFAVRLAT